MPALPVKALHKRNATPSRTITAIIGLVAFVVIAAGLIAVLIRPRFRKKPKVIPGLSRYPVVPYYPHQPFGPPPSFPSHPSLLRNFRKQAPTPVRHYDPRVETPFPNTPIELHPTRGLGQPVTHSDGLFTPPQCCFPMKRQQKYLPNRNAGAVRQAAAPDPRQFSAFNRNHDYILPVPEPLVLKPRPAGRPPPLTRQLERFPMPLSSNRTGKVVHPVKLFQELENRESQATSETLGTPCPNPQTSKRTHATEMSAMTAVAQDVHQESDKDVESVSNTLKSTPVFTFPKARFQLPTSEVEPSKKPEPQKQEKLQRMGKLTRPKTPVAEIREYFNRAASEAKKDKSSSKRTYTPTSNPFTTPGVSSTPATSQEPPSTKTPAPSTPPNLKLEDAGSGMNARFHRHRRTPSSVILPQTEEFMGFTPTTKHRKGHRSVKGSPPKHSASIDHLRTKIDDWILHTGNLDRSLFASPVIKRSISDTGLQWTTVQHCDGRNASIMQGTSMPLVQIGRSSDDVFGIEADGFQSNQADILTKRVAHVGTSPVTMGGSARGVAPGGGEWI